MARLDEDALLRAINRAEEQSYGGDDDLLSSERAYSLQLYNGEDVDPAPAGRSQVVDRSVFETVQWILPSLTRIFAGGGDLVSIPPIGPDDEEGAKQEAEYVNWVIQQQNPWFETFLTWATDALVTRNAYALAYMDKTRVTEVERYEKQTAEGVALLLEDKDVEVISSKEYPEDAEPQPMIDPATGQPAMGPDGQPVMQPPTMLYDLEIRRVAEKRKVCINVLPPDRCKVSQNTPTWRLADCPYFEYWEMKPISELRAMGFDLPDDFADDGESDDTLEAEARDPYRDTASENEHEPAMRRLRTRMIWIRHDSDGDGVAELFYCLRVGNKILHAEEVSCIPVACLVPSTVPHRHIGMSITDMVHDIQRIKTAILRQGLDNLYLTNKPQRIIDQNRVNLDDLLTNVPGGIIRVDGDINAVRYEQVPFVLPQTFEAIEYMNSVSENRVGVNRYFSGTDANALNKTATGIQTLSTMAAQRVEQIARIMAAGVEDLARAVHEIILKSGHKKETVRLRGQWVEVDPATWRKRSDFKISVGFASGNKDTMVNRLQMIAANQLQALQLGLPIVQPQNFHETMMELTKASDFSSPERFWTDPQLAPPQQQQTDPALIKVQADSTAKAAELELKQEEISANAQLKEKELAIKAKEVETKAEIEIYKIDKDAEVKIALAKLQAEYTAEVEEKRGEREKEKDVRKARMEGKDIEYNETAEKTKEELGGMKELIQSVTTEVKRSLNAKRRIKRGPDGKAIGVEIVDGDGKVIGIQSVVRGRDGRVEGTA